MKKLGQVKEINDTTLQEFIDDYMDISDFGHLIVPNDERINSEALSIIKRKFREFIGSEEEG